MKFQKSWIIAAGIFLLGQSFTAGMEEFHKKDDQTDTSDVYESSEESEFFVPHKLWEEQNKDFEDVSLYVNDLLNPSLFEQLNPNQIAVVLDVDGTLTNYSDPTAHQGAAQARGKAVQSVEEWIQKGINIVVSSAWHPFEETIQRLKDIGLGDVLRINEGEIQRENGNLFGMAVEYAQLGLVASVKDETDKDSVFFRLKAFAFYYIVPRPELKTIKYWVFADDNSDNVSLFRKYIDQIYSESQIKKEDVPEGVIVKTFCLSVVKGEATLK